MPRQFLLTRIKRLSTGLVITTAFKLLVAVRKRLSSCLSLFRQAGLRTSHLSGGHNGPNLKIQLTPS